MLAAAAIPPAGTVVTNVATSSQQVGASLQSATTNTVVTTVGSVTITPAPATLTKSFASAVVAPGSSTPLSFRLTNAAGNPAQTGIAFTDTLPSGLRLTTGATSNVIGAGCTASVTLTAPSTISITAATISLGTATCDIVVNGITNVAAANADCTANPAAFTNGSSSISGLANAANGVTNQCLVVTSTPTLTKTFTANVIPVGGSTPLNFRLTNAAGNPAQTGIAFTDTLPSGLRLTTGATSTVVGAGCTANVTLTAPSTVSITGATMSAGTATCDITVNAITSVAAANNDCTANPAAFTNGSSSISGLANASNGVTNQCLVVTSLPALSKTFTSNVIPVGGSTPLNFRLTNAAGNPAQTGIAFTDTLPSGLRLTTGATSTVVGAGCTANVTLIAPSTISITAATMSTGTATCDIVVNGITNVAAANADCTANPAAFTNGSSSISGLANASNGVTNQCMVITPLFTLVANPVCIRNTPYVDYSLSSSGAPVTSGVQIEWQKTTGQTVSTLTNLPLSGRILWPGAEVDPRGNPIAWPGWVFDGNAYQAIKDGLRPDLRMIFTTNASKTVVVSYPASDFSCDPNPPVAPPAKPNLDVTLIKWINQNYGISPSGRYNVTVRYANTINSDGTKSGVLVSDALPKGMLFVPGSLRVRPLPANVAIALPDASGSLMLNGVAATYAASANLVSVLFSSLNPGDAGFLEFDVNIDQGVAVDTIIQNTAKVTWLDAMGAPVDPRLSNTIDFRVIGSEGVTLTGMTIPKVDPGSTAVFENVLVNQTGRTDTFDITLSGSNYPQGTIFKLYKSDGVTLLADTNGNGIADTGPVAAGATYRIIVKAQIPFGVPAGGPYTIVKSAVSITNPLVRAAANDIATVSAFCRVIFEPNNRGRVAPGGTLTYSHTVTNVGNCTETITVPASYLTSVVQGTSASSSSQIRTGGKTAEPAITAAAISVQGWTAQAFLDNPKAGGQSIVGVLDPADAELLPTTTFVLAPTASAILLDRITAPANATNGMTNTTTLRINASITGPLSVDDTTTVAIGSTGDIIDNIIGYIDPGFLRPSVWGFIGKTLYLRANAPSCNNDPLVIERRTIIITGPNGEREEIIATETGPDTGMFIADLLNIRLPPVLPGDKVLQGIPFDVFDIELVGCGRKITTTLTLIDPNGVVFDSRTNQPIAGATVRIVTAPGGICSSTAATVSQLVMGQVVPAPNVAVTGADGRFNFELVSPGDYCVLVTPPNGYTFASRVPVSQLPGGRNILSTGPTTGGSYGGSLRAGPETGPVIVDIPVDGGLIGGLFVQKIASRTVVEIGEFLDYSVAVSNKTGYALDMNDVFLTDNLPHGFSYVPGTARRDGKAIADPQGGVGPRLVFNLGRMNRDQLSNVTYRIRVGPGAMQGDGINRVVASYRISAASALPGAGSTLYSESNIATAKVDIVGGVFSDRAYIVGKVFADCNNDGVQTAERSGAVAEHGIPGVRLLLEDGTSATTDSEGKYSFYGLLAKTRVLKVDRTTLPDGVTGADFALLSNRNLGKGDSRIVDLKNGQLHKANFAINVCSDKVLAEIDKRRLAATSLKSEVEGRLQQKLETDPNLRALNDLKALPATGEVGNTAPSANIAAPASLGAAPVTAAGSASVAPKATSFFNTLAVPQSEPATKRREQPTREPEVDLEKLLPAEDNKLGFIGLKSGDILPYAQTTIRVKGTSGTTFKLKVNNKEINADRVGKKAVFAEKSSQAWEFFGIDLAVGENTLTIAQLDEFGNARGEVSIKVIAPGALASVKISFAASKNPDGAVADGRTPATVVISLADRNNVPITSRTAITLSTSLGRWAAEDLNPNEPGLQTFVEGGRATFELIPPVDPGQAQITVSSGDIEAEAKLDFLPDLREMVAAGVIEGVLNLRKLDARGFAPARAQDGFDQEITHIARTWGNGERDAGARAAMYIKGKVLGSYLLTMAYDSDKNTRERLFRDIQPDEFYPVYGDSSVRAFDAQSTGRFYVRIDNKKSYMLYGDFNTSQANDARKLSNYSRSLTGIKQHYENSRLSVNGFASRDTTRQVVDEFAANGTSGPFSLTRASGLINSEKIEVLTRDRNQPALILRAQPLSRFVDYELEALTGRILFKSPIPSLDEKLNPISIRITYEVDQGGAQFWTAGVDAQVKVTDNIEVGAVVIDDRNPLDKFRMLGVNAIAKLADKTFLVAELARTRRDVTSSLLPGNAQTALAPGEKTGDAKRIEFRHGGTDFDASFYAARADENFDNPSASLTRGRQEVGGKLSYRFDEKTRIKGELLRTEDIAAGGKRDGMLLVIERTLDNGLRVEAGIRHARESQPSGAAVAGVTVPNELTAVRVRVTGDVPGLKAASAYAEAEVDVQDSARKIAAVGGDYKLGETGRLYLRHEFISSLTGPYGLNSQQRQNSTVFGVNTDYMKDGNIFSEYRVRDAISGGDAEAALGLRNMWTLADGLKMHTGFERVHAMSGKGTGEATAGTVGLEYTANALWKGSTRLEVRNGKSSDSILATVAAAAKLGRDWTFLGRNTYSVLKNKSLDTAQSSGENEQNRLQAGLAYRDTETDVWNALARVEHQSQNDTTTKEMKLKRSVELISLHANWQPRRPFTFSARIAAKWANENSNGVSSKNNAQLIAGRAIWEIAPRWDASLNMSTLHGNSGKSNYYGVGVELGFMVMDNLWLSAGYNFFGYTDKDLTAGEYTSKGAFVRLRYKFDEDLFATSKAAKATAAKESNGATISTDAKPTAGKTEPKEGV